MACRLSAVCRRTTWPSQGFGSALGWGKLGEIYKLARQDSITSTLRRAGRPGATTMDLAAEAGVPESVQAVVDMMGEPRSPLCPVLFPRPSPANTAAGGRHMEAGPANRWRSMAALGKP